MLLLTVFAARQWVGEGVTLEVAPWGDTVQRGWGRCPGWGGWEGDACCTVILTHTRHAHRWCVVSCAVSRVVYGSHQKNVSSTRVKATP